MWVAFQRRKDPIALAHLHFNRHLDKARHIPILKGEQLNFFGIKFLLTESTIRLGQGATGETAQMADVTDEALARLNLTRQK